MVNCNPETVSTDYDTSDRLYFEPLRGRGGAGDLRARAAGGRRHPVRWPDAAQAARARSSRRASASWARPTRRSTSPRTASASPSSAAARDRRARLAHGGRPAAAVEAAEEIGYPVLVRPSYVLGGPAHARLLRARRTSRARPREPAGVLVDRFLEGAVELDVDALCDGEETWVAALMEHVEEAGVHSGDSSCVLPPVGLAAEVLDRMRRDRDPARAGARSRRAHKRPARAPATAASTSSRRTRAPLGRCPSSPRPWA